MFAELDQFIGRYIPETGLMNLPDKLGRDTMFSKLDQFIGRYIPETGLMNLANKFWRNFMFTELDQQGGRNIFEAQVMNILLQSFCPGVGEAFLYRYLDSRQESFLPYLPASAAGVYYKIGRYLSSSYSVTWVR